MKNIAQDVIRSDSNNDFFQIIDDDWLSKRGNPFVNILYAYAMYDPIVDYHQGMNMIALFILNLCELENAGIS